MKHLDRTCIFIAQAIHAAFAYFTGLTSFSAFVNVGIVLTVIGYTISASTDVVLGRAFGMMIWTFAGLLIIPCTTFLMRSAAAQLDSATDLLPHALLPLHSTARLFVFIELAITVAGGLPPLALLRVAWLISTWAMVGGRPPTRTLPGDLQHLARSLTARPVPAPIPS